MRELTGMQAVTTLPGAGTTRAIEYTCDGKQGGVETPEEWNALTDYIREPLVVSEAERGFVFPFTYAVWADNIILFATSWDMLLDRGSVSRMETFFSRVPRGRHFGRYDVRASGRRAE